MKYDLVWLSELNNELWENEKAFNSYPMGNEKTNLNKLCDFINYSFFKIVFCFFNTEVSCKVADTLKWVGWGWGYILNT